jgi:hypothetical protein
MRLIGLGLFDPSTGQRTSYTFQVGDHQHFVQCAAFPGLKSCGPRAGQRQFIQRAAHRRRRCRRPPLTRPAAGSRRPWRAYWRQLDEGEIFQSPKCSAFIRKKSGGAAQNLGR